MNRGTVEMEHRVLSRRISTVTNDIDAALNEIWADERGKRNYVITQLRKRYIMMEELIHVKARFAHCVRRP